jgi:Lrp/AsnC family transcriptional regulator, regulator for asnA, asnC and gidA
MQIVAVTDPLQVGFPAPGDDRHPGRRRPEAVADALAAMPEVDYVVITAGSSTSSPRSSARTTTTCSRCSTSRIRAIPGVRTTETFVYLKLRKQIYTWGTR